MDGLQSITSTNLIITSTIIILIVASLEQNYSKSHNTYFFSAQEMHMQ